MAANFGAAGTADANSGRTVAPSLSGFNAGEYLIAEFAQKYGDRTVPTPSGWTPLGHVVGGAGTDGTIDEGQVALWFFGKQADGTEGSTLSVTDSGGTPSCFAGRVYSLTKGSSESWDISAAVTASDNVAGTSLAFTYSADPGIAAGDLVVTGWVSNSDAYTHTHAISIPGCSSITTQSRGNVAVTAGANLRYGFVTHAIGAGTSTGAATYTNTASGSATNAPAGASILVRLRVISTAVAPPGNLLAGGLHTLSGGLQS